VPDVLLPQVRERNTVFVTQTARQSSQSRTNLGHRAVYTADLFMPDATELPRPLSLVV
jgi:hypothetical protein